MFTLNQDNPSHSHDVSENLSQHLARVIGRKIVSGEIAANTLLQKASKLSEEFGVSRTVVREAMKSLTAKGLVRSRQKAGTFVNPRQDWHLFDRDILNWLLEGGLEKNLLEQLIELRLSIEPTVAKLAAVRALPDDIARICQSYERMRRADSAQAYYEGDLDFHSSLFAACHNEFLLQLEPVVMLILRSTFKIQYRLLIDRSEGCKLHLRVLEKIEVHDPDGAETAMRYIIDMARDELAASYKAVTATRLSGQD